MSATEELVFEAFKLMANGDGDGRMDEAAEKQALIRKVPALVIGERWQRVTPGAI